MADAVSKIFEKLMDIVKAPVWFTASIVVLILYSLKVNLFGLYYFITSYKPMITIVFLLCLLSGLLCICDLVSRLGRWIGRRQVKRKLSQPSYEKLNNLTNEQKMNLRKLIASQRNTCNLKRSEEMEDLENMNIVASSELSDALLAYGHSRYTINSWAVKYLEKRTRLLKV